MSEETAANLSVEGGGQRLPVVAIVGRPNVGKSTLFNRLARAPRALVDSRPGVTRDRNMVTARWRDRPFVIVDTGGFEEREDGGLGAAVRAQSLRAAAEADAVIAVFDGRAGLNPLDREFVKRLRRLPVPVVYAVNKLDSPARDDEAADFFALGEMNVFPISAAHGRGIDELMERLLAHLPAGAAVAPPAGDAVRVAIVGRPNVGKSSLLNRLVGEERMIVAASPGTTRDAVDTPVRRGEREYVLVDTAGIRRRPRVQEQLEHASVVRALRALERAEVGVLVIDAVEGMTDQDARIATHARDRGRALLLVVNKWDALGRAERDRTAYVRRLREHYPTLADVPAACVSARTGVRVADLFPAIDQLVAVQRASVRTAELNVALTAAQRAQAPPAVRGRRARIYYATQTASAPPTFVLFANAPELLPAAYLRYLTNVVRERFGLEGAALRLRVRAAPKGRRRSRRSA